jgi:cytochrome c553
VTRRVLAIGVALGIAASAVLLAVAASGLPPLSAADGHWRATEWLVQLAKRRSVMLRGDGIQAPPLDDAALIARGAGHYETACRRCHGAPGGGPPVLLREMTPQPPDLRRVRNRYSPGELFHIVKHGFKLSGMPGWPAQQRDDEVWAMVALLEALPSLGDTGYERAANPLPPLEAAMPAVVQDQCVRCHGTDGRGRVAGAFPILGGQHEEYLYLSLRAFAYGARHSGIMMAVAGPLSDLEMRQAAAYYSRLPGLSVRPLDADAGPGAGIVHAGLPDRKVPSCASCHQQEAAVNPAFPRLAGQDRRYLSLQLQLFAERRRGGTAFAELMHHAADGLTDDARGAAAAYFGAR